MDWRAKTGRIVPGVELRIVDDAGTVLPWDGAAVGEIEVRGPWVTASYYLDEDTQKFHDGWLRTGDVGTVDARGFIQITDRAKDVIKSGGEWISSVDLENDLMAHPDVIEAAVIGVPDARWDERPLACVVLRENAETRPDELRAFLDRSRRALVAAAKWAFIEQVPEDQRRQVRQEGAARALRRGEARGGRSRRRRGRIARRELSAITA